MAFVFFSIFSLASYPMDWIDSGVGLLNEFLNSFISNCKEKQIKIRT